MNERGYVPFNTICSVVRLYRGSNVQKDETKDNNNNNSPFRYPLVRSKLSLASDMRYHYIMKRPKPDFEIKSSDLLSLCTIVEWNTIKVLRYSPVANLKCQIMFALIK